MFLAYVFGHYTIRFDQVKPVKRYRDDLLRRDVLIKRIEKFLRHNLERVALLFRSRFTSNAFYRFITTWTVMNYLQSYLSAVLMNLFFFFLFNYINIILYIYKYNFFILIINIKFALRLERIPLN